MLIFQLIILNIHFYIDLIELEELMFIISKIILSMIQSNYNLFLSFFIYISKNNDYLTFQILFLLIS